METEGIHCQQSIDASSLECQAEHLTSGEKDSKMLLQYQNFHLHFIQKKEPLTTRCMIPSTKWNRLAFYRNIVASPNKAMRVLFKVDNFIWLYILNVFFKTIPHYYVQMFMASYVPEQHGFLCRMSPCFHGVKFVLVFVALFELMYFLKNIILLVDYVLHGFILKNPWNFCTSLRLPKQNVTYTCYTVNEVFNKTSNGNVTTEVIDGIRFSVVDGVRFLLVEVEYFYKRYFHMPPYLKRFYVLILWVVAAVLSNFIFRRWYWKFLNAMQTFVMVLFLLAYIHTTLSTIKIYQEKEMKNITLSTNTSAVIYSDLDAFLEPTVAPPIIHILTSRSVQEILPIRDSAVIVISNSLFYLFRGLLTYRLQIHCELLVNAPLTSDYNYMCWFYLWPIYLNSFYLGDIYTLLYFIINFIVEFTTFIVAFQCLIEFASEEWKNLNSGLIKTFLTISGIIFYVAFPDMDYVCIMSKLMVNMIEIIVIYIMYPLPRLLDDLTFHIGSPPTKLGVFIFLIIIFVAALIFWVCLSCISEDDQVKNNTQYMEGIIFILIFLPLILIMGFVYNVLKFRYEKRLPFCHMFVPDESWGPSDYNLRQLRKQYDSRYYIGSQAPRNLSRYLIAKAESKCYHLDLRYESDKRISMPTTDFRRENEKKNL